MNKIYVTEKSDGTALRLVVMNNELYFEAMKNKYADEVYNAISDFDLQGD